MGTTDTIMKEGISIGLTPGKDIIIRLGGSKGGGGYGSGVTYTQDGESDLAHQKPHVYTRDMQLEVGIVRRVMVPITFACQEMRSTLAGQVSHGLLIFMELNMKQQTESSVVPRRITISHALSVTFLDHPR